MKAVFKNFLKDLALAATVMALVSFMSYKTYDYTLYTHIGSGIAAAGAFVFIFSGFGSARGFMTKT